MVMDKKKLVCVTLLTHNEKEFLPLWLKYYHNSFPWEDIYVHDHCSNDGSIIYSDNDLSEQTYLPYGTFRTKNLFCNIATVQKHNLKCNVFKVWKDVEKGEQFWDINWMQETYRAIIVKLLKKYEYVISVDIDDFLFSNPEKYKNLRHYVEVLKENGIANSRATGYELVHLPDKEPDLDWNKLY